MSSLPRYLLDSSVLIQAHRLYYRFTTCPGFWESVIWHCKQGRIRSIDKVVEELAAGKDALAHWANKTCPKPFFEKTTDQAIGATYGKLIIWAHGKSQFTPAALSTFATVADGWLVAYAHEHKYTLVTLEEPAPASQTEVKIPDVCRAHSVDYVNTFQMLEQLDISFEWTAP